MRLPKKDVVATGLVTAAGLVYLLWIIGSTLPGMSTIRASGIVVVVLGFAASASAVVPTFDQLLHGNRAYLAATSLLGLATLIGGVSVLVAGSDAGFAVTMVAMVTLWLIATIHHSLLARSAESPNVDHRGGQG